MTARRVLLVCLLVTLLSSANGLVCNIISLPPLLCGLGLCSLNALINWFCPNTQNALIAIEFNTGIIGIKLDTDLVGLDIRAGNGASVSLELLGVISIATDLNITGDTTVSIAAGSAISIVGNVNLLSPKSVLKIGGSVVVQGTTLIRGKLQFTGSSPSSTSLQSAWFNSSHTVIVEGTSPEAPAQVTGNGGVNANVTTVGYVTAGETGVYSSIYVAKSLQVITDSVFKVNGNVTVEGDSTVNGNLHLGSLTVGSGNNQTVWFRPLSSVVVAGTETNAATMSGNGGVHGDCYLGDYGGISPGNSPGSTHYIGNLLMSDMSFLMLECYGSGTNQFDKITMTGTFFRGGSIQVNFGNGYIPGHNDRIAWSFHSGATGVFKTVYGQSMTAVFTNLTTGYVYSEPDSTCYCQCVNV